MQYINKRPVDIALIVWIVFIIAIVFASCKVKVQFKDTRSDFKDGEIILPDYAHLDTLIVANGQMLNAAIDSVATDTEIDSVLHLYCKPYNKIK